jgi:hypothetical protein
MSKACDVTRGAYTWSSPDVADHQVFVEREQLTSAAAPKSISLLELSPRPRCRFRSMTV